MSFKPSFISLGDRPRGMDAVGEPEAGVSSILFLIVEEKPGRVVHEVFISWLFLFLVIPRGEARGVAASFVVLGARPVSRLARLGRLSRVSVRELEVTLKLGITFSFIW